MNVFSNLFAVLILGMLSIAGCDGKPQYAPSGQGAKVLARVNGVPLTAEDVAFRLQEAHGNKPQYGNKSIDDIVNQELLYQQGLKLGLDKDPSYQRKFLKPEGVSSGAKRLEMARLVFNTQIASHIDVRFTDGKEYYDKNADRIATELHLEMARFDNRPEAEAALKKVRDGASFESIARPVMGTTPVDGRMPWDLGFVTWDKVPVDFVDSVYTLKPGEVSGILGSGPTGFQIVKLRASRRVPKVDYPVISATVMNRLRDKKLLEAYNQYVEQLREKATIEKLEKGGES